MTSAFSHINQKIKKKRSLLAFNNSSCLPPSLECSVPSTFVNKSVKWPIITSLRFILLFLYKQSENGFCLVHTRFLYGFLLGLGIVNAMGMEMYFFVLCLSEKYCFNCTDL